MYAPDCLEASLTPYWGDDDEETTEVVGVAPADDTNEADCDDGF